MKKDLQYIGKYIYCKYEIPTYRGIYTRKYLSIYHPRYIYEIVHTKVFYDLVFCFVYRYVSAISLSICMERVGVRISICIYYIFPICGVISGVDPRSLCIQTRYIPYSISKNLLFHYPIYYESHIRHMRDPIWHRKRYICSVYRGTPSG
jgi:hypothetical protein